MNISRTVAIGLVLVACALSPVAAQEARLASVDVATATARIENLEGVNQTSRTTIDQNQATINDLTTQINQRNTEMIEIRPILDRVSTELTDLVAFSRGIVDADLRTQSQEAVGRARAIRTGLENSLRTLNRQNTEATQQIEALRTQNRVLTQRIADNENEIAYLQAAIAQTQQQRQRVQDYVGSVDSLLNDADRFLQQRGGAE